MGDLLQILLILWLFTAAVYVLADAALRLVGGRGRKDEGLGG